MLIKRVTLTAELFPGAHDRVDNTAAAAPSAEVLRRLARLREEPDSDEGSTADEGAPPGGTGWVGTGKTMQIGSGYTKRDLCDGKTLASPGSWPIELRNYPEDETWQFVAGLPTDFARRVGTPTLLTSLAIGQVSDSHFSTDSIRALKQAVVEGLATGGFSLARKEGDRTDVPLDFRYLDLLLRAASDPEVALGSFAGGVRVGPGERVPRLPAL